MDILLANIGNRNITYQNKTYNELEISQKFHENYISFKDWTKSLLDNINTEKEYLDINIINPLIQSDSKFDLIIIYYSDQSQFNTRTDQDTIHEAAIIEYLLIEKYYHEPNGISKVKVDAKVIDNAALLNFYRLEIVRFKKAYKNLSVTICDAGGTAQQKMALKVIAEFLLEPVQYNVLYVEKNELVTDVNINEYRNIINTEQAITLIHSGEYLAAAELLNYTNLHDVQQALKYDWKARVLGHVIFRFHQNKKDAKAIIQGKPISNEIIKNYLAGVAFSNNSELEELFGKDWIDITEKLYKSIFYYNLNNYSLSILSFSQFYEYFLEKLVPLLLPPYEFGTCNAQTADQLQNYIDVFNQNYSVYLKERPDFRPKIGSVNSDIMVVKALGCQSSKRFASLISPYVHFTDDCKKGITLLNVSRNQIAHEGKFITRIDIKKKLSYFPGIIAETKEIFKLTKDDLFKELGNLMESILRN